MGARRAGRGFMGALKSRDELRDLERRWRSTGDPGLEVAYFLARVRIGEVEPSFVALAAFLGYLPARRLHKLSDGVHDDLIFWINSCFKARHDYRRPGRLLP